MGAKFFFSTMVGAPVLSGTAGAAIAILDACLVNGFNSVTLDSLVISGGVATANRSAGMTFEQDGVVLIAGITGGAAALNGERRVLSFNANSFTFDATGVSNQTATGTITARYSPAGWAKEFSGTNLAVYRSADTTSGSRRMYYRLDDTGTLNARLVGYEAMTDVNTGTGAFPTTAQVSGGGYLPKSSAANTTARNWIVVADERTVYWWCEPNAATTVTSQGVIYGFGDLNPRNSSDGYATFVSCPTADSTTAAGIPADLCSMSNPSTAMGFALTCPRSWIGTGTSTSVGCYSESRKANSTAARSGSGSLPFPNGPDNGLELERALVLEADFTTRGTFPGLWHLPQNVGFAFSTYDKVPGSGVLAGRKLLALRSGTLSQATQNGSSNPAVAMLDITGPWR